MSPYIFPLSILTSLTPAHVTTLHPAHLAASIPYTLSHENIVVVSSLGCDNISVEDRLQVTLEANTVQCYQLSASANVAPVPRVSPPIAACHNKTETSITTTANCKYRRLINCFMGAF